jgi:hypothetical protein
VASKKTGNPVGRPKGAVSLDGKGGYLVTLGRRVVDQLRAGARPRRELQRRDPAAGEAKSRVA